MKCLILLFISINANAALQMEAGLWEIKTSVKTDGKIVDPQAQIKKAMAKMTPEQRKQMEAMMGGSGAAGISDDGAIKICFSKELLSNDDALMQQDNKDCKIEFPEKTAQKVRIQYDCKNGSKGEGHWNIKSGGKTYDGLMSMTRKNGKKSEISHEGKWVSGDCGSVKPFNPKELPARPTLKR